MNKKILYKNEYFDATLFHEGYFSDLYLFNYHDKRYLVKYFIEKKESNKLEHFSINDFFLREIDGLKRLNTIRSEKLVVPKIIFINKEELYYIQEFLEFESFNVFLVKNSNCLRNNTNIYLILFQFGEILAKLHNKYRIDGDICYLHGDLNNKNIGFKNNKIFVLDPSSYRFLYKNSQYCEIARVIMNIYPYNIIYNCFTFYKKELLKTFLKGYIKHSDVSFSKDKLIYYLNMHINYSNKTIMSYKPKYLLKFIYIKIINKLIFRNMSQTIRNLSQEEFDGKI